MTKNKQDREKTWEKVQIKVREGPQLLQLILLLILLALSFLFIFRPLPLGSTPTSRKEV